MTTDDLRAENKRLREALSSALGYLSAETDEQARRICQQGRDALRLAFDEARER